MEKPSGLTKDSDSATTCPVNGEKFCDARDGLLGHALPLGIQRHMRVDTARRAD